MLCFKPRVGKVKTGQTIGRFTIISSFNNIHGCISLPDSDLVHQEEVLSWNATTRSYLRRRRGGRDGNFSLPLPASPRASFPRPAKVVGWGWGKILVLHHGASRDGFRLFRPSSSPPCLAPRC